MSGFFIQSRFGTQGNFEVVVPSEASGGLVHFWRNNDASGFPWSGPTLFGGSFGNIDGVSLIQSNFGSPGNLEVIAVANGQLYHFWRDSTGWQGPYIIPSSVGIVAGLPGLIQGTFGTTGNFEVVAPSSSGGLVHFWRNNDDPNLPWSGPTPFGVGFGNFDGVSLIQSNFGSPGNLELIAEAGGQLYHFWRDSTGWQGPFNISTSGGVGIVGGIAGLIQGTFGTRGNFEAVAPSSSGGLVHFWRNNDDPSLPWGAPTPFGLGLQIGRIPSLIQGNFGSPGDLEVVVGAPGGDLLHFYRDSTGWHGPDLAESGV
jgi:hypothetical protein